MKRFLPFLLLVLMLMLLSGSAGAETGFDFSAEKYTKGFSDFYWLAYQQQVDWQAPITAESGLEYWTSSSTDDIPPIRVYTSTDSKVCTGIGFDASTTLDETGVYQMGYHIGSLSPIIMAVCRYTELDFDKGKMKDELSDILQFGPALLTQFTEAMSSAALKPCAFTQTYLGHTAQFTLEINTDTKLLKVSFLFVP